MHGLEKPEVLRRERLAAADYDGPQRATVQVKVIVGAMRVGTPLIVEHIFFGVPVPETEAPDVRLRLAHEKMQDFVHHEAAVQHIRHPQAQQFRNRPALALEIAERQIGGVVSGVGNQ